MSLDLSEFTQQQQSILEFLSDGALHSIGEIRDHIDRHSTESSIRMCISRMRPKMRSHAHDITCQVIGNGKNVPRRYVYRLVRLLRQEFDDEE